MDVRNTNLEATILPPHTTHFTRVIGNIVEEPNTSSVSDIFSGSRSPADFAFMQTWRHFDGGISPGSEVGF